MAHLDVASVSYVLPDGRPLLRDVSFRVGDGDRTALIGANGAGKSTLLGIVAGAVEASAGVVSRSGELGVMPQFLEDGTVRELLLSVAPVEIRRAAARLARAESRMRDADTTETQMAFARAVTEWGDVGGYDMDVVWDTCTIAALGVPFESCRDRQLATLSGGERKRLALESLLLGPQPLLLLDEPDNSLDVPGKIWLEERLRSSDKGVLFVSHDRELLARAASSIVTLELGAAGNTAWTHVGGFGDYHVARERRFERFDELRRRWDEERSKLRDLVLMYKQKAAYNSDMASRYRAARTRLARFEDAGPPQEQPRGQHLDMRLRGGRTGKRVITCGGVELTGLMRPFDLEILYGDRVAVLGSNGSGKSHFLRLLAGSEPADGERRVEGDAFTIEPVDHTGIVRLGARARTGWFAQNRARPDLEGRTLLEILHRGEGARAGMPREAASRALARYELAHSAEQRYESLSGGQRARLQILLLELGGATVLLLDEPTDNLDLVSAEALQAALRAFDGTVLAVTHDRWFVRDFERFLVFGADGVVRERDGAVWDEGRVERDRG